MEEVVSKLKQTPWGWAIEHNDQLLHIYGSHDASKFDDKTIYVCSIGYHILFPKDLEKSNRGWSDIRGESVQQVKEDPDFRMYNLSEEKIRPHIEKIRPVLAD